MTMLSGAPIASSVPAEDRRRHRRIAVALLGRYRLATLQEYPCLSVDISLGGIALLAPVKAAAGERVVLHLEQIGTLEGRVVRHTMTGFALELRLSARGRDRLQAQLAWLENRHTLGLPERRRHRRFVPLHSAVMVRHADGHAVAARLVDVSRSGAAVLLDPQPPVGAVLILGTTEGRVVRHFDGGVGVEFTRPLLGPRFDEDVVL